MQNLRVNHDKYTQPIRHWFTWGETCRWSELQQPQGVPMEKVPNTWKSVQGQTQIRSEHEQTRQAKENQFKREGLRGEWETESWSCINQARGGRCERNSGQSQVVWVSAIQFFSSRRTMEKILKSTQEFSMGGWYKHPIFCYLTKEYFKQIPNSNSKASETFNLDTKHTILLKCIDA